ncbi:siderophore synthetase [Clostridium sp. 'White wine YQ']|uniref:siderophore synthetase n=1 Tax=Clostridium sp. 'White wine YQ' TaxID=3027474 RepID=UPI002365782E|nr:siderophore synthetase [Clostridium sp. 'White wine YQ']MDD7793172.1 siderophore synthetase [Clostridium sp. 'White wine YQ']
MRFKAELFDELQFMFEKNKFNDHVLHCIINFNGKIDKVILKKAIEMTLDIIPILGSRYVEGKNKAYWIKEDKLNYKEILKVVDNEEEFNDFITSKINEFKATQVKACVFCSKNDSLAINMNHMICDAAGFKQYMYLLCEIYSNLTREQAYKPEFVMNGDRSIDRITGKFTLKENIKVFVTQNSESNKQFNYTFPLSSNEKRLPFIITHNISKDRFQLIKVYSKKNKVTINDIVLAAYYRVMFKILEVQNGNELNIPIMIDMRRYLEERNIDALCNLASTVITSLKFDSQESLLETVKRLSVSINKKKVNQLGLNGFVKISAIYKIFSYKNFKRLLTFGFKHPLIAMTNIGILDEDKLCFKGTQIKDAYMCGSIKYPPYFQLAISSYKESLTLSVNLYGSTKDKERIKEFLELLDNEFPKQ